MTREEIMNTLPDMVICMAGAAFKSGRPCIPALDQSFHALLDGVKVGEGIPLLNAWIKGWTNANLREELQWLKLLS